MLYVMPTSVRTTPDNSLEVFMWLMGSIVKKVVGGVIGTVGRNVATSGVVTGAIVFE
jgi:hypothetical protein